MGFSASLRYPVQNSGTKLDGFLKSRHSGVQKFCNQLKKLDSGLRRNDRKWCFLTFYEIIKFDGFVKTYQLDGTVIPPIGRRTDGLFTKPSLFIPSRGLVYV